MKDSILFYKGLINTATKKIDGALKLLGWLDANEVKYKIQQDKFTIINGGEQNPESSTSQGTSEKGGEMTKTKHLYHRKDGRWEYTFFKDGVRTYYIASTRDKVLEKVKAYKAEKVEKNPETAKKTTFLGWTEYWLKTYKKNLKSTDNYESIIRNYIAKYFKDMPLARLTPAILQEFLNSFDSNSRTLDMAYLTLRQSLKTAYINDNISRNLADFLIKPRKTRKPKKTALSLAEQSRFLAELQKYDLDVRMFMMFSLIAGTRREETWKFNLSDIDESKQRIYIHGTKTELSERRIKVTQEFIELLKTKQTTPYFLRQPHYYSKIANEIFKKANIVGKSLHDLRHTCSTNLHYLGWPDKERQAHLGHASIVMTNDIYTNLQEDITKDGLLKLYNNLYPIFLT